MVSRIVKIQRLQSDLAQAARDISILLANIDYLEEVHGEGLDGDDAIICAQIRNSLKHGYLMPYMSQQEERSDDT